MCFDVILLEISIWFNSERQRDRQTDRQTDRQIDRQTDRQRSKDTRTVSSRAPVKN